MYKLTGSTNVIRLSDGAGIPFDPANRDYAEYQAWLDEGNTPEPWQTGAEQLAGIQRGLTTALNNHLNQVAGQRSYDDRFTCSLRAGYPGPFQEEGQAFASWMDECNMVAYQILADVKRGLRAIPTEAELIEALPVIAWPASPVPGGA